MRRLSNPYGFSSSGNDCDVLFPMAWTIRWPVDSSKEHVPKPRPHIMPADPVMEYVNPLTVFGVYGHHPDEGMRTVDVESSLHERDFLRSIQFGSSFRFSMFLMHRNSVGSDMFSGCWATAGFAANHVATAGKSALIQTVEFSIPLLMSTPLSTTCHAHYWTSAGAGSVGPLMERQR